MSFSFCSLHWPLGCSTIFSWWLWVLSYSNFLRVLSECYCYRWCLVFMPFICNYGFYPTRVYWFHCTWLAACLYSIFLLPWPVTVVWSWDFTCCGKVLFHHRRVGKLCASFSVGDSLSTRLLDILILSNLIKCCFFNIQHGCFCNRVYIILRVLYIDTLYWNLFAGTWDYICQPWRRVYWLSLKAVASNG